MKFKGLLSSLAGASFLALTTSASAITIMIGDNDGYGYGDAVVPDGADLPVTAVPGCAWCFDNRSAAELVATDGSQYTDFEAYQAPVTFTIGFDATAYSNISSVLFTMDVTGIQQNAFGPSTLLLDGVDYSAGLPINQGAWGSGVYSFSVSSADLLDGLLDVYFMGGPNDHIGFDFFALNFDAQDVPEPTTLSMLGLGLVLLGFTTRKRKTT